MTPAQAHTRRLKGIAYGYAASEASAVAELRMIDGVYLDLTPADLRRVYQYLERIALDLRNKAHEYESEGEG